MHWNEFHRPGFTLRRKGSGLSAAHGSAAVNLPCGCWHHGGTTLVDNYRDTWWMQMAGPTALALSTDEKSFPNSIADPYYPVGIIAGVSEGNNNDDILPGPDDGLVPMESTKINRKRKMTEFDLLNKTELKIAPILLDTANLTHIAAAVAETLGMEHSDVLVVDYREGSLVLDILNTCVNAYKIVGKKETLLETLGALPGVSVSGKTEIISNGMLGWIALDKDPATEALKQSEKIVSEIRNNISKRVIIFSSGAEVAKNEIEDTNMPTLKNHLESEGYKVDSGEVLKDENLFIAAKLREAAELGGYSVIITTGGVGAEDKDHTVEAVTAIDPAAATPYICHFKTGTGRHVKDGVKIAVGDYNGTRIIALPGPNDEVKASLGPMVHGLKAGLEKQDLAEMIAANLRQILRRKMKGGHWHEGCQLHGRN